MSARRISPARVEVTSDTAGTPGTTHVATPPAAHPHPVPPPAAGTPSGRSLRGWARKSAVTVTGGALLVAGAAMLVLPGPGILVILAGLAVLATEYAWAHRLLTRMRERASQAARTVRERSRRPRPAGDPGPPEPGSGYMGGVACGPACAAGATEPNRPTAGTSTSTNPAS